MTWPSNKGTSSGKNVSKFWNASVGAAGNQKEVRLYERMRVKVVNALAKQILHEAKKEMR